MNDNHRKSEPSSTIKNKLENLANKVSTSGKSIVSLKESFDRIEKLIAVVRGITSKTDLLALNASIEAARAGHSGKGFAVVAHEVARLAEKSQESIQNVDAVFGELKDGFVSIMANVDQCTTCLSDMLETFDGTLASDAEDKAA